MTLDRWHFSVLIPARDEEDLLPRCLESVLAAREALLDVASCDVVVAVDSSIDDTLAIAQRMLGNAGVAIQCTAGIVGVARASAAKVALQRRTQTPSRIWLANTDADCWVPPTWLTEQPESAEAGVQAIAGIVDVDSFAEHDECVSLQERGVSAECRESHNGYDRSTRRRLHIERRKIKRRTHKVAACNQL